MSQDRFRLDREVAVVTGGGRGIGLACAEALAEAGARIVLIERDETVGREGQATLGAKGHRAELILGDVTDSARMTGIADSLALDAGPATILVNNAGIGTTGTSPSTSTTPTGSAPWT